MPFVFVDMTKEDLARVSSLRKQQDVRVFGVFSRAGAWVVDRERNVFAHQLHEIHPRYTRSRFILSLDDTLAVIEIDPDAYLQGTAWFLYLPPSLEGRSGEVAALFMEAFATESPEMGRFGSLWVSSVTFVAPPGPKR